MIERPRISHTLATARQDPGARSTHRDCTAEPDCDRMTPFGAAILAGLASAMLTIWMVLVSDIHFALWLPIYGAVGTGLTLTIVLAQDARHKVLKGRGWS